MSTKRPLSTISFNTDSYLQSVLNDLCQDGFIQSYIYIKHFAEEDTKKDHIHLMLVPSRPVDACKVRKRFIEPCADGDLQCLPFQLSKLTDWLLYAMHFPPYLVRKGIVRVHHYNLQEFSTNEPYEWLEDIFSRGSEELENKRVSTFLDRVNNGDDFGTILASGLVPFNQVIFYDKLYHTYRPNDNYEDWLRATKGIKKMVKITPQVLSKNSANVS